MYEVIFETGSLKGKRWRIPTDGVLTIGRSHSCGIRPKEPDVSGKHAVLREEAGVVWLEVLSSHKTAVDGIRLPVGERVAITEVSQVALGGGLAFRLGKTSADDETGEIMPAETGTLGTGTLATAATRAAGTATLGDETGTLATAATRAAGTATLGDETGTLATAATRAAGTATLGDETGTLATAATRAAGTATLGDETGTLATAATRVAGPAAHKPAGAPLRRVGADLDLKGRRQVRTAGAVPADEGETQMVTGLTPLAAAQGDTELATGDSQDGGETQVLATQAISQTELNILRGAHVRKQKQKLGLRAVVFIVTFGAIFALYAWLSHPNVKTYLSSATLCSFDGVIRTEDGQVAIDVPSYNDGRYSVKNESLVRYDSKLGDKWEVPFTIVITNYVDKQSLREDAEETFARWRTANMVGLWRDQGELRLPQFLGGLAGKYPGVRCLVHKYTKVDADGENLAGTAAFFRTGDTCHVLLREIPAAEEGRGRNWLNMVDWTLFVNDRRADKTENLFAARHWEGTSAEDDERDCSVVLNECRQRLESEDVTAWNDVERMLYVTLRTLDGRSDAEAKDIRAGALDALQRLRKAQAKDWHNCQSVAFQAANRPGDEGSKALAAITETAREHFNSQNDERYWLSRQERWWLVKPGDAR